jgi:hypothetical protein
MEYIPMYTVLNHLLKVILDAIIFFPGLKDEFNVAEKKFKNWLPYDMSKKI